MKIGLVLPQISDLATKQNIIKFAVDAENEGFDSLWVAERLLWPIKPQTPYPGTPDGTLPTYFQRVFDPLETLTFVAAKTQKIALCTSVIDMLFHNPVILVKRFATLDLYSEGRAICGLGIGWSKDEYQASNIPFKDRGKRADEFLQVMKKIWTEDVVEFEGQFYNIPPSIIEPKPLQKPHIPIYLGGYVPRTFARIAIHADGWVAAISGPIDFLKHGINTLKEEAQKIGKNSKDFKNTVLVVPQIASSPIPTNNNSNTTEKSQNHLNANGVSQFPFCGTVEQIAKDIQEVKHIGFDQIVFGFANLEFDKVIDTAKELSKFAK